MVPLWAVPAAEAIDLWSDNWHSTCHLPPHRSAFRSPTSQRPGRYARPSGSLRGHRVEGATGAGAAVMGGSYRQCSECGKRALSIATRCPGCGRELEPQPAPETRPVLEVGRYLPSGVVAAVALAAVVLAVELGGERLPSDPARSSAAAGSAAADSIAASSEVAYAMGATARLDSASVEATPAGGILVAKTWTNVRQSRSTARRARRSAFAGGHRLRRLAPARLVPGRARGRSDGVRLPHDTDDAGALRRPQP